MERPTIEQTSWVFERLADNLLCPGSFRKVIYDRMGYGPDAYSPLYLAGGMSITNASIEADDWRVLQIVAHRHHGLRFLEDGRGGWTLGTWDEQISASGRDMESTIGAFRTAVSKAHPDLDVGTDEAERYAQVVEHLMLMNEQERQELWQQSGHSGKALMALVSGR